MTSLKQYGLIFLFAFSIIGCKDKSVEKKSNDSRETSVDSGKKVKIDDSWYRDYTVLLDSYDDSYHYAYYIQISKDSCYIVERPLKDLLTPYQSGDTLFLYHKKSILEGSDYKGDKNIPEVKIVKLKDSYYVSSPVFDLKNSISTKPEKYGFLAE